MEFVLQLYQGFETIYMGLNTILGFDPFLIFTIFLIVGGLRALIGPFTPAKYRRQILTTLCFIASFALLYLVDHEPTTWIKSSIILGSITSFTYDIFKATLQWSIDRLMTRLEASSGKDYEDPELPL